MTFPQHIKISKAPKRNLKKFNEQAFLLDILDVNWDKHLDLDRQDATLSTNKFLHIIRPCQETRAIALARAGTRKIFCQCDLSHAQDFVLCCYFKYRNTSYG